MADVILYNAFGAPLSHDRKPPVADQAKTTRRKEAWSGRSAAFKPEKVASVLRGTADLPTQMAMIQAALEDDHLFACVRNLANSVSRLRIIAKSYDEKSAVANKEAEDAQKLLDGARWLHQLVFHLTFGEVYPFVAPGIRWSKDYLPVEWINVDPRRWTREPKSGDLRIRTQANPLRGEELEPNAFCFHYSALEPGAPFDGGLWRKLLWLCVFKVSSWEWYMRFAQKYGKPWIWAFYQRGDSPDTILQAIADMDEEACGAFPAGTDVKLQEAQRYGTVALYDAIRRAAEEGMTKLVQGHVLNVDARSGTGTLAGNAAENVSVENRQGVATGISGSLQRGVLNPYWGFNYANGWRAVEREELPIVEIDATPPEDDEKVAKIFVSVNQALAASGHAIDPDHIGQRFKVPIVEITRPEPKAPDSGEDPEKAKRGGQRATTAKGDAPAIATLDDVSALTRAFVESHVRELSTALRAKLEGSTSIEEFSAAIWEAYGELGDTTKIASALRDATLTAHMIGRGDAAE